MRKKYLIIFSAHEGLILCCDWSASNGRIVSGSGIQSTIAPVVGVVILANTAFRVSAVVVVVVNVCVLVVAIFLMVSYFLLET